MRGVLLVQLILIGFALGVQQYTQRYPHATVQTFNRFIQEHGKSYTPEEYLIRLGHFHESLKRSEQRNKKSSGRTQFGVTKFSDLSSEEFRQQYLTAKVSAYERKEGVPTLTPKITTEEAPKELDYRKQGFVTKVKDQGQCGSCWAVSVTESIESQWIMAGKAKADDLALSMQQIVDCDDSDGGCNGGEPGSAYDYVIAAGGIESNASYPYAAVDQTCSFQQNETVAKISTWQYATSWYSETELKENLVSWGPLSVCVDAASWQDYVSGVMTWENCAYINLLDHCVQLVGYGTDAQAGDYWIVRNSWGTSWGIDGYIHLEIGYDTCGIAHQATSPIV